MIAADRLKRALLALDGLSVGDSFGERFFHGNALDRVVNRELPAGRWWWTDDTAMAVGLLEVLARRGTIDQDDLAGTFARNHAIDPGRGYGAGAHQILDEIESGTPWRAAAGAAFSGKGSMGNGSAMRVAPLGAYFADDLELCVSQARLSAEVTHAHPEGAAGAIAVAVAAALVARGETSFFDTVLQRTPPSRTRDGIERARSGSFPTWREAALALGNGSDVTCPDTVPFTLWSAHRHLASWEEAMWNTVAAFGDRDTTCAIVGGIVALRSPIPPAWLAAREPLPDFLPVR